MTSTAPGHTTHDSTLMRVKINYMYQEIFSEFVDVVTSIVIYQWLSLSFMKKD